MAVSAFQRDVLDAVVVVVVVVVGSVAPGIGAMQEELFAGGDAEVPGAGRIGEYGEGGGTV